MELPVKPVIAQVVIKILKPLIRVLMRNDISHGEFAELAKHAYIDVAREHFTLPGRKMTHSRVAVVTGLNRKEVMRLSGQSPEQLRPRKGTTNRALRVVTGWLTDADFLDASQNPRHLDLKDELSGFPKLASAYSGDITSRALLDELQRLELVDIVDGEVLLLNRGYIPHNDPRELLEIMGTCASDLLETAAHNIEHDTSQNYFQRQLVYYDVDAATAEAFRRYSHKKATAMLSGLNHWLTRHATKSQNHAVKRLGIGIYYYQDSDTAEIQQKQGTQRRKHHGQPGRKDKSLIT